ncbi:MAG: GAF domain-containing protein [Elusimicrobia bacterium]|nr:GAF domain-containing protein [Elusimicrobiota bacterium]
MILSLILPVLCVFLVLALSLALWQLYRVRSQFPEEGLPSSTDQVLPDALRKMDALLSMVIEIHERARSEFGGASKREVCQTIVENACKLLQTSTASLMLLDDQGELRVVASKGLVQSAVEQVRIRRGEGIAGRVVEKGQVIFVEDPAKDPRYLPADPVIDCQHPFVCVPLWVRNKTVGVLNVHTPQPLQRFEDPDIKLLTILANQAAIALENLDLYDDLQTFYLEMVQTLARAIDAKDAYTHDHADRARQTARKLAHALGLPDEMVRYVEYAALLHDIGKIGVDETILQKPGKLTAEEYEVMKRHPAIGHQILAPVKFLGPVARMVLYHQEWYNGQGYPEGLKGEEIPLGARIVAIIDAWDAMTSDRPYRKALPREKAISELRKGAGTQFDPRAVEAFLKIEEQEFRHRQLAGENHRAPHSHPSKDLPSASQAPSPPH